MTGVYFGPYLQQSGVERDQLVRDLAEVYSASASEYYANVDLQKAPAASLDKSSPYYLELHREQDQHYGQFLAASTKLAAEVPPSLPEQILSIEDSFDQ